MAGERDWTGVSRNSCLRLLFATRTTISLRHSRWMGRGEGRGGRGEREGRERGEGRGEREGRGKGRERGEREGERGRGEGKEERSHIIWHYRLNYGNTLTKR